MNKEELIEKIERNKFTRNTTDFEIGYNLASNTIINDLKQLDEPTKPVVPQFVADWIKYCKFTNVNLQNALLVGDVYFYNYANQKDFSKLKEFLDTENNQETFARAWLDGYTVEEEKRYLVKAKNATYNEFPQFLCKNNRGIYWSTSIDCYKPTHTRKELEQAGFGWVFSCEGIEVEEVEK